MFSATQHICSKWFDLNSGAALTVTVNSQQDSQAPEAYAFGHYVLRLRPLALWDGTRRVNLAPRRLAVLSMIVQAQGKIATKEMLFGGVWQDLMVEAGNLTQTVFLIRRALGNLPDGGDFIETVPRRGYRLAAKALDSGQQSKCLGWAQCGYEEKDGWFRLLVDSIDDYAIFMLDCGGHILTWNRGAENCGGYSSHEVVGRHCSLIFPPEEVEAHTPERELATATRTGRCLGEGWRLRKNGERFWASFTLSPMHSREGRLIGFAEVLRDLSDRKRQEDALLSMGATVRRERDQLHAAAENSLDALFICHAVRDEHGEIEDFGFSYVSSRVERILPAAREVVVNGTMRALLPRFLGEGFFDECKRVLESRQSYVAELRVRREEEADEWIRMQVVPLTDGVAVTLTDINDRKWSEVLIAPGDLDSAARRSAGHTAAPYAMTINFLNAFKPGEH